jgi:hypothetical protein
VLGAGGAIGLKRHAEPGLLLSPGLNGRRPDVVCLEEVQRCPTPPNRSSPTDARPRLM